VTRASYRKPFEVSSRKGDLNENTFTRCWNFDFGRCDNRSCCFHHAATRRNCNSQQSDGQKKVEKFKTQTLLGDGARLRANQLRKLNKGVARAMRDAERKGLHEAFDKGAVVLATNRPDAGTARIPRAQLSTIRKTSFRTASQDYSDGEYEVSFLPYDDGDPNTWEGIIYRNGPDIDEDTRSTVISIANEEPQVIQETYYPPDGGDPCSTGDGSRCYYTVRSERKQPSLAQTISACEQPQLRSFVKPTMWSSLLPQGCPSGSHRCIGKEAMGCCGPIPPIDNWAKCSIFGSGASAISCLGTGPGWGACFSARAGAAMFLCLKAA